MKEWWSKATEKWNTLAIREKRVLSVGAGFVLFCIVYLGLWKPYLDSLASLRQQITDEQKTLAWMQAADTALSALEKKTKGRGRAVSMMELLEYIQKQIHQAGLGQNLAHLQQASNETVEIHLQKIEFDQLMELLGTLVKTQAISITQMSVTLNGSPGIVNADVVLSTSPPNTG